MIFRQTVNEIHIRANEFPRAGNILYKIFSMMCDELQVKVGDVKTEDLATRLLMMYILCAICGINEKG